MGIRIPLDEEGEKQEEEEEGEEIDNNSNENRINNRNPNTNNGYNRYRYLNVLDWPRVLHLYEYPTKQPPMQHDSAYGYGYSISHRLPTQDLHESETNEETRQGEEDDGDIDDNESSNCNSKNNS